MQSSSLVSVADQFPLKPRADPDVQEGTWRQVATSRTETPADSRVDGYGGARRLAVEQAGDGVRLFVDGEMVHAMEAEGDVGLLVDASRVRFRVVTPVRVASSAAGAG